MNDLQEFFDIVGTNCIEKGAEKEIMDFLGFITSHPDTIKIGSSHDASIVVELYEEWKWQRERGLRNPHTR
jgi:hypothetical protein